MIICLFLGTPTWSQGPQTLCDIWRSEEDTGDQGRARIRISWIYQHNKQLLPRGDRQILLSRIQRCPAREGGDIRPCIVITSTHASHNNLSLWSQPVILIDDSKSSDRSVWTHDWDDQINIVINMIRWWRDLMSGSVNGKEMNRVYIRPGKFTVFKFNIAIIQ